ncbi:lipoxygenase 1 protein [Rutstroemia sp. NJR-2017a BBW]|nr:lipoxygenase 1 protein [Rutstroemia sp. NJR-2017a BBW]
MSQLTNGNTDRNGSAIPATNGSTTMIPKLKLGPDEKKPNLFRRILRRPKRNANPKVAAGTMVVAPAEFNEATAQLFVALEDRYSESFKIKGYESGRPFVARKFETQKVLYQWRLSQQSNPPYPPHLAYIPLEEETPLFKIFNFTRLVDVAVSLLPAIPSAISYLLYGDPIGRTMADCETRMRVLRRELKNIGEEPSIGDRNDWYSDAAFAQQYFTGPNPASIALAGELWTMRFKDSAKAQGNTDMHSLLSFAEPSSLYIQDCSFFREYVGATPESTLKSENGKRFGCASVTLFHLSAEGQLHPLAIILDFRGNMAKSVVIFNRRVNATDSVEHEATDWPWRYAKMCSLVADWTHHELTLHLNDCHFIEEATIVAAFRSFPSSHIVYRILEPHWLKTLSLNAAARATLVPDVVNRINGFTAKQTYQYLLSSYKNFNWTENYIPTSLEKRGFPLAALSSKTEARFHNYTYGKNMIIMWPILLEFVTSMLKTFYNTDSDVAKDTAVASWCKEMRSPTGGQMPTFPTIATLDDLANAITMCIHIASPQHNAINYPQNYYMSFIPNKPPSLATPLPSSLQALQRYTESDVVNALPVNDEGVWIQASQLPYLLSYRVAEDQTLSAYAKDLIDSSKAATAAAADKTPFGGESALGKKKDDGITKAAQKLLKDLERAGREFRENSDMLDEGIEAYRVMDPGELAVSVLI